MATLDFDLHFWADDDVELRAVHRLFVERIGRDLVEPWESFRVSAALPTSDWQPALVVAVHQTELAGALLGGLLPAVGMTNLPYTAIATRFERQGLYPRMKTALLMELRRLAAGRGMAEPWANLGEEAEGSDHYLRKVAGGFARPLPVAYAQPAALGLPERPLALTLEPLTTAQPRLDRQAYAEMVAALYRGVYRIAQPEQHPTYRRFIDALTRSPVPA